MYTNQNNGCKNFITKILITLKEIKMMPGGTSMQLRRNHRASEHVPSGITMQVSGNLYLHQDASLLKAKPFKLKMTPFLFSERQESNTLFLIITAEI